MGQLTRLKSGHIVGRQFLDVVLSELQHVVSQPDKMKLLVEACSRARPTIAREHKGQFKEWFFVPHSQQLHPSVCEVVKASVANENDQFILRRPELDHLPDPAMPLAS